MNAQRLGSVARVLRIRQRLTQGALALRAGVSRQAVSLLERGEARSLRVGVVEAALAAVDARVDLRVLWNGPDLDRLLDAGHAALTAVVKRRLERLGWVVRVEVSYNHFGERGRVDILAWHPATGILLVVEIKTDLVDVQSLLGTLDAKTRIASTIAAPMGWRVSGVVPVIVSPRTARSGGTLRASTRCSTGSPSAAAPPRTGSASPPPSRAACCGSARSLAPRVELVARTGSGSAVLDNCRVERH